MEIREIEIGQKCVHTDAAGEQRRVVVRSFWRGGDDMRRMKEPRVFCATADGVVIGTHPSRLSLV